MDMDDVECNKEILCQNDDCIMEMQADSLLFMGSDDEDNGEETRPLPRLGEEYQAQIPMLFSENEHHKLCANACCSDELSDPGYFIGVRLPIPIAWVRQEVDHVECEGNDLPGSAAVHEGKAGSVESMDFEKCCNCSKYSSVGEHLHERFCNYGPQGSKCSVHFSDVPSKGTSCNVKLPDEWPKQDKEVIGPKGPIFATLNDQINLLHHSLPLNEAKIPYAFPGYPLVTWSDADSANFLVGLYIFGKSFVQIKKFMERKKIGDILSFYYGKFYRSDAYHRWSECRKIRSRKCIYGQRIFTGWRQQELLSRIACDVSKEDNDTLLEASRTFNDGRISLEEYVLNIKAQVGLTKLVEAIGVGKGKHDLTGIVIDPIRSNHAISIRPEIPVGKACSSLTSADIVKFLTGDFRLSKAKSNDLFWEAVWPRLLATGWHSEQPLDLASVGSKSTLVFLAPGVRKFSRKRLVKGKHYFSSVSDVLNKVASDPRLLELEIEGGVNSKRLDQKDPSDYQSHSYLCQKLPNVNHEIMEFTVVDTSMCCGEAPPYKLRELRNFPIEAFNTSTISKLLEKTESDSLEEHLDAADIASSNQGEPLPAVGNEMKDVLELDSSADLVNLLKRKTAEKEYEPSDRSHDILISTKPACDIQNQFNFGLKSGQRICFSPVSKRRRLAACKQTGSGHRPFLPSSGQKLNKEDAHPECGSFIRKEIKDTVTVPSQGIRFASSFVRGSSHGSSHRCTSALREITVSKGNESLKPPIFDLNVPQFFPDTKSTEPALTDLPGSWLHESSLMSGTNQQIDSFHTFRTSEDMLNMQGPATNAVRHSTRSRPLTMKALEAFACGFLSTGRKPKGTKAHPTSRSSRRARRRPRSTINVDATRPSAMITNDGKQEEYGSYINYASNSGMEVYLNYRSYANHANIYNDSCVQSDSKETHEVLGVP